MRTAIVLIVFAAVFIGLTVSSYRQESATADEPQHLTFGYAALRLADYRVDIEHPPFLRLWAALPVLAMTDIRFETNATWLSTAKSSQISHQFLYVDNDADRLLNRARSMIVLLGVLLGALLFSWSRELFGFWPATVVLGLYCLEPAILAHFGLVTTDAGMACFTFGVVYFLWRTIKRVTAWNLSALVVFFALAQVSKFSALVLFPIVFTLLAIHAYRTRRWSLPVGTAVALAVISYLAIWAAYGFRYAPAPAGSGLDRIVSGPNAHNRLPTLTAVTDWVDERQLLPNTYTQGFAIGQAAAQRRTGYLLGQISDTGWWYYFPVALLVKVPLTLVVLVVVGLGVCVMNRSKFWDTDIYILLPSVVYLCAAMTTNLNLGVRHTLPIYPLMLLIGGKAVAATLGSGRRPLVVALVALCMFQIAEVAAVHPHHLAFFNQLIGGPKNGYKYLSDSNIDWGQDLQNLKHWMDDNGVEHINLAYFGSADPEYYGINCTYLRGSPPFATNKVEQAVLPGLVAVSVHNLTGAGLDGDPLYKPLLDVEPVAVVGYSIRIYRVDKPWW